MFHSIIISEPLAQLLGLIVGLAAYGLTGFITPNHEVRLITGGIASVATNLLIGAKVNLALLDALGLIVARPLSAYAGVHLLGFVTKALIG